MLAMFRNPRADDLYGIDLRDKRAWIFFSHVNGCLKKNVLGYFDGNGSETDSVVKKGASLYLYDMSGPGNGQAD